MADTSKSQEEFNAETGTLRARVAELEQAEEALRESEHKYRTLFETMALGVVYQNAEGEITAANPAASPTPRALIKEGRSL